MSKIIDISSKLSYEPQFLHIAEGKDYKVDETKNAVIKIMDAWNNPEIDDMEKINLTILHALGKKAAAEINSMELSLKGYKSIAMAILAIIADEDVDEFEARFLESSK